MTLRPTFYPKNTVKRLAASLLSKKYHFIGDGYMRNKIKYLWRSHSMLIIVCGGLLGIFTIPWLFTRDWFASFASYTNLGQIGDTIGGTTAPFIGLLSAVLVYRALQAQIKANEIIQKQIEKQEKESAERQKHENFMKMYEAYVRVLSDGLLVKRTIDNNSTRIKAQLNSFPPQTLDQIIKAIKENSKGGSFIGKDLHKLFFGELDPLMRMVYHLLKKELAQEGPQKWDNIRFFIAQLSEDELIAMAINCLYDPEGKNGLALVAKKTGLFQHLKSKGCKKSLQEQPDPEGFFNLEMTEDKYKDKSVKI
jgi:hypothetical protein